MTEVVDRATGEVTEDGKKFDAGKYLTQLSGRDYLEVKWRLLWLRTEHPEARVETTLISDEGQRAVFKAVVTIPPVYEGSTERGKGTGHGSETFQDFGDYLEKAETKAIGRALAALGFGTQFCDDFADGHRTGRPVDAPVGNAVPLSGTASVRRPIVQQQAAPQAPRQQGNYAAPSEKMGKFLKSLVKGEFDDWDIVNSYLDAVPNLTGSECSAAITYFKERKDRAATDSPDELAVVVGRKQPVVRGNPGPEPEIDDDEMPF